MKTIFFQTGMVLRLQTAQVCKSNSLWVRTLTKSGGLLAEVRKVNFRASESNDGPSAIL